MKTKPTINSLKLTLSRRNREIAELKHQLEVERARVNELRNGVGVMVDKITEKVVLMAQQKDKT